MSPYLELTEFAEVVNKLAVMSNDNNMEVRCIMPRFGVINERRHRLHEVVRLSGINVTIDNDDYPLIIKVASLPNARLQVYFLDNEDYFKRKSIFTDEKDKWFDDNAIRTVLFCKEPWKQSKIRMASRYYPLQRLDDRPYPDVHQSGIQKGAGFQ